MENAEPRKRGRPRKAPDTQEGQVVHVRLGARAMKRLDIEWRKRGAQSRAEVIRALIDEALGLK